MIKKKVQNAKKKNNNNNLQVRIKRSKVVHINESSNLLSEIENGQITYEEALKRIENISNNINKVINI